MRLIPRMDLSVHCIIIGCFKGLCTLRRQVAFLVHHFLSILVCGMGFAFARCCRAGKPARRPCWGGSSYSLTTRRMHLSANCLQCCYATLERFWWFHSIRCSTGQKFTVGKIRVCFSVHYYYCPQTSGSGSSFSFQRKK